MTAEPTAARQSHARIDKIRTALQHRFELLAAIRNFQHALARPSGDPGWRHGVACQLPRLRSAFVTHVELTGGPEGLYAEVLADAPRLARQVSDLSREHATMAEALDALALAVDAEPERVRAWGAELLRELSRHRQRGADLVHQAYATDLGGET
ncbi:hypothetical protein [Planosporangium mesophilum]|nr:hypothetical protein [Planosporangium mesophilum]NJC84921.1 hypothetical protein [Planosporangium mesophilum]